MKDLTKKFKPDSHYPGYEIDRRNKKIMKYLVPLPFFAGGFATWEMGNWVWRHPEFKENFPLGTWHVLPIGVGIITFFLFIFIYFFIGFTLTTVLDLLQKNKGK